MWQPVYAQQPESDQNTSSPTTPDSGKLFAKSVNQDELTWLNIGEKQIPALYLSETSGRAHGAVLLIPKSGRRPTTVGPINKIRISLADHHWHTLALDMTSAANADGSVKPEMTQSAIKAGIGHLNKQGIYNIAILGEGAGAISALKYIDSLPKEDTSKQIRALIMINARHSAGKSGNDTLKILGGIDLPVLDAWTDDPYLKRAAKQRKVAANKQQKRLYQQIKLPRHAAFVQGTEDRTSKQIRSWLDRNVAGFMVQE